MRMGLAFSETFWGLFLIFLGIIFILKVTLGLNIPVFRVVLAFFLIYMGISLLIGGRFKPRVDKNTILFSDSKIEATKPGEKYDIVFSSGTIDLTGIDNIEKVSRVDVNTVFGSGVIRLNRDIPVVIKANSAFASISLPNGNQVTFGDQYYRSENYQEGQPYLELHTDVVFGSLSIER